ncbi:MAG: SseB family protein, partial [Lachnospiraceae bacterium]|nr:SseB family protein [Lachnospiraceae bacterium]
MDAKSINEPGTRTAGDTGINGAGHNVDESAYSVVQGEGAALKGDVFWNRGDFAFEILKVLAYKEQGSVLIGRALSGQLLSGEKAAYTDRDGRAVFHCTVGSIEQSGFKAKKASVCQFGLLGPTFTFIIPDFAPNAFKEGNFLYQKLEEGEELSPVLKAFESCRLTVAREEEIRRVMEEGMSGEMVSLEQDVVKQLCEDYSVQEMIFALTYLRDMGNRAKEAGENETKESLKAKADAIYRTMLEKLRGLDKVYLTIDKNTNYPFYNGGFVDVYTKEEYAKLAVLYYGEQFRELEVRALPVSNAQLLRPEEGKPLAAQMPAFVLFFYLGMERVLLDNGLFRAALSRGDVLPPPDFSDKPAAAVPITNPSLRTRMIDFFGEARWKVNYEKRGEVLRAKEHVMLTEVAKAKFLIPMKYEGAAKPEPGTNQIVFNKDTNLMFAAGKNTAGESYTPIFTDFVELGKMYQPK